MMTTRTRPSSRRTTGTAAAYTRIGISLSLGLLVLACGMSLAEAAGPKRLGVLTFRGPGEGATRNAVMKAGKAKKYQIIGGQQISKAASKMKVTLDTNDSFQKVARELGIAAFVTGEVSKKKATLTVRNGNDGSVTAEASWTGPNPRKLSAAVSKTFWRRLGSAIDRAKAPTGAKQAVVAQEEAAPESGADDGDDDEGKGKGKGKAKSAANTVAAADDGGDRERSKKNGKSTKDSSDEAGSETVVSASPEPEKEEGGGPRMEALMVSVGPRAVNRALSYNDNTDVNANRNYKLALAPELALNVDVFPAAFSRGGFISNVGLTASVAYLLPVVTTPAGTPAMPLPGSYKTYSLDWSIGVKVRFPIGVYGTLAYGAQRYQLTRPANNITDIVPMVDYRFVRIGAGGRIPITPVITLMAHAAYLHVLSFGQIGGPNYFPKTKGAGIEAGVGAGYRITPMFEVQAGIDIRRYGLAFNITAADFNANPAIRVVGGAVDQYLTGWAGLAMIWGGDHRASSASSPAADDESTEAKPDDEEKAKDDDAEAEEEKADGKSGKDKDEEKL